MTADEHAAEVDALRRRYPGWTVWFGSFTRHWWALPPRGRGPAHLLEAETPQRLIARIEVVQHGDASIAAPPGPDGNPRSQPRWPLGTRHLPSVSGSTADPRRDARRPSNLLRLEGVTPAPFGRVPVIVWPGSTAR
jgi:hypothetical protein